MAHKKGSGSTKNGRDSNSNRLGIKVCGYHFVKSGTIIVRQRGLSVRPGYDVGVGKDYTLFALQSGYVIFEDDKNLKYVSIWPDWWFWTRAKRQQPYKVKRKKDTLRKILHILEEKANTKLEKEFKTMC